MHKIFTNERFIINPPKINDPLESLEGGTDLQNIIDKAKSLSEYEAVKEHFTSFKDNTTYTGSIILIIIVVGVLVWKFPAIGGLPLLIISKCFTGCCRSKPPQQTSPQQVPQQAPWQVGPCPSSFQTAPYILPVQTTALTMPNLRNIIQSMDAPVQLTIMPNGPSRQLPALQY